MSSFKYNNPPGAAEKHSDLCHFSQTVDLGNGTIKCAGQGGWHPDTGAIDANDMEGQVRLAFENIDLILRSAGLRGWEDVYLVRSYHCDIRTSFQPVVDALKRRISGHRPVWTALAVPHLAFPGMLIEIEVEAKRQE